MTEKDKTAPIEFEQASLQKSIDDFQTGVTLVKNLQSQLQDAEQKVEILIQESNGELSQQPFNNESE